MKRQRNTQQIKEQDKCPPNQTKEEEIGNLPDKEFRIMIVKLIQNLEIKMESQINSLETRIEKMQERFNKDLEEIKKSQYIMNNAINEIKNTLEATNSRITEAEDRISELGCSIEEACNSLEFTLEEYHLSLLLIARNYYRDGNYNTGDNYLKQVEKATGKTKKVISKMDEIRRNKKFYIHRMNAGIQLTKSSK